MTFDDFKVIAMAMRTMYPSDNFMNTPEALKLWYKLLGDMPYEVVNASVQKYMLTEKFPPKVSEIRRIAIELMEGEQKDWGYGWEQVRTAIRKYGVYDPTGALESMDDITREVVKRMGWNEICLSENQEVDRANFRMLYEQVSKKDAEVKQLPPKLQEQLQRLEVKMLEE